ncbi:MAG: adenylate/guanylate cyclase domain-containing protein [Bacteroidota bacterium]
MESLTSAKPSGTVTFLFTDVEGSTRLAREHPESWEALRRRHEEILRAAIEQARGYLFKEIGDAFCAGFPTAGDAVRAAIQAQRDLQRENWGDEPVKVRMGIHTGKAEIQEDGGYQGYLTLSLVQRLMSAAHGGQVLLSMSTQELVLDELPDGVTLRDMGERRLKDMVRPEHIYQLVVAGLPADFPPINTADARRHNLPAQMTSFIGREREVHDIRRTLAEHRLVTLTGSGGAGKTRLAIQVGTEYVEQFPGGVWLAELAAVTDAGLVPQTLVSIFNLRAERRRSAVDVLIDYLNGKTALLVLDNCEHLIEACAQTGEALLKACPDLRILATSREALGIAGEFAYRVPSLYTPDPEHLPPLEELEKVEAVRLFVERAAAAKPGFALKKENAAALAQICARLDGIPLAIELAASRVKVLAPEQIARRLDDRFQLLTGGTRTALQRHQTLRALIDWSYGLLSAEEKRLFRRLAVFAGGWTLDAAEAVCGEEKGGPEVLDLLTRLVEKSLVFIEEFDGEIRYHRLETIRQYSRERLLETDEVNAVRDRHLEYFVTFAELVDDRLKGGEQVRWQRRMAAELDNLRAALDWGLNRDPDRALQIAGAANLFWTAGGYSAEGFRWTQKALEAVENTPLPPGLRPDQRLLARARALRGLTRLYLSLGDNSRARRAAEESVALYRQSPDRRGLAFALVVLAYPLEFLGERDRAEAALQESNAIAHEEGDVYTVCRSLNLLARIVLDLYHDLGLSKAYAEESIRLAREAGLRSQEAQASEILGSIANRRSDYDEARAYFRESIRVYEEMGARFNVTLEQSNLAHLERGLGNYEKALGYYRETIAAFRDIGQTGAVAHQLECFGFIARAQSHDERAAQLFAAASALRETAGTPRTPDEEPYFEAQLRGLQQEMDPAQFGALWSRGHAMGIERAIEFALQEVDG